MLGVSDPPHHLPGEEPGVTDAQTGEQTEQQTRHTSWECSEHFGEERQPSAWSAE